MEYFTTLEHYMYQTFLKEEFIFIPKSTCLMTISASSFILIPSFVSASKSKVRYVFESAFVNLIKTNEISQTLNLVSDMERTDIIEFMGTESHRNVFFIYHSSTKNAMCGLVMANGTRI